MKYAWVKAHANKFSVSVMCDILALWRSNYYAWLKASPSTHALEEVSLIEETKAIFIDSQCTYGARRIRRALMLLGYSISRRRVRKLMKKGELFCKTNRRFRVTTDSRHNFPIAPNILNRHFTAPGPNEKYVGDITYIWTQAGWLYLAVVIDLFSRQVVGWSMDKQMKAELVNDALLMAIGKQKPSPGLLWHTDRGSQ